MQFLKLMTLNVQLQHLQQKWQGDPLVSVRAALCQCDFAGTWHYRFCTWVFFVVILSTAIIIGGCGKKPPPPEDERDRYFERGLKYLNSGEYYNAIEDFNDAIDFARKVAGASEPVDIYYCRGIAARMYAADMEEQGWKGFLNKWDPRIRRYRENSIRDLQKVLESDASYKDSKEQMELAVLERKAYEREMKTRKEAFVEKHLKEIERLVGKPEDYVSAYNLVRDMIKEENSRFDFTEEKALLLGVYAFSPFDEYSDINAENAHAYLLKQINTGSKTPWDVYCFTKTNQVVLSKIAGYILGLAKVKWTLSQTFSPRDSWVAKYNDLLEDYDAAIEMLNDKMKPFVGLLPIEELGENTDRDYAMENGKAVVEGDAKPAFIFTLSDAADLLNSKDAITKGEGAALLDAVGQIKLAYLAVLIAKIGENTDLPKTNTKLIAMLKDIKSFYKHVDDAIEKHQVAMYYLPYASQDIIKHYKRSDGIFKDLYMEDTENIIVDVLEIPFPDWWLDDLR